MWESTSSVASVNNIIKQTNSKARTRSHSSRSLPARDNNHLFKISYKIHDGFTSREERIITIALYIVANRLFKPEILKNMYHICGTSRYFLAPEVWERSQLENHSKYHGPCDLLRYQLMCLKVKSEKDEFPIIHIRPIYKEDSASGSGRVGCISCISHGSKFSIDGEFEVKLNRYNIDRPNPDVVYWAGVIVHEMLHNLGHKHEVNDYSDNWQINILKQCFIHNGNYYP